MTANHLEVGLSCLLAFVSAPVLACERGTVALFSCDAAQGRKFIELCAPSPLNAASGYLVYRFGSLADDGSESAVELEYPTETAGSLKRFYAATYTHKGVYTQSVRFISGDFGYTVFTRSRGAETIGAGVEVRHRKSGRTSVVRCNERPRFYIHELKGLLACDKETPIGTACVK